MLVSLIGFQSAHAQTLEEIKKRADGNFEKGEFLKAKQDYLRVISSQDYAKDPDVNFRYGTCLIYSDGNEKKKAIAHLSFAVKMPGIDNRAFYYLGKAYHLDYQFNKALTYYNQFKQKASSSELKAFDVDADIKACQNGKKLLTNITDIIVLEKTEIKSEDFYELYKLKDFGGNILVTDQFQSKYDKKVGHRPVIHFPQNSPYIFYSSYGQDGATGLDIYVQKKLPNGEWALPQKIIGGVNTFQDENYPYMSPDGQYLYFCSKGHNSMGGYDVFRSRYNPEDNSFSAPDNMDFAISSPDDDILYVVDSLDRLAYFSSARESEQGKMMVYKVRVEKIPMQFAVVKGSFINEVASSNKTIEFIINDFNNGAEIGTFKSKPRNGDFLITFPKSGKYTFTMTVGGSEVSHQAVVEIPYLREFRPLKMRVTHYKDPVNGEMIKVEPLFNEEFDNPTEILAEVYREISKLNPNSDNFDLDSLDKMRETDEIFVDAGLDPYSTKSDVEKVVEDRIEDVEEQIEENRKNVNVAYHLAEENNLKADELVADANTLINQAENESDPSKKNELLQQAYIKKEQAKKLNQEAKNYIEIADKIKQENVKLNQDLITAKQTLVDVKNVGEGDRMALTNVVEKNNVFFENQVKNVDNTTVIERIEKEGSQQQSEFSKINDEIVSLNNQKTSLEKENEKLRIDLQNAKKKKEKERIEKIIGSNESELDLINQTLAQNEKKLDEMVDNNNGSSQLINQANKITDPDYDNINYTKDLTDAEINQIKTNTNNGKIDTEITKIEKVLTDNNVKGQYVSITGLDESRTDLTIQEWEEAYDKEINAKKLQLNQTTDPVEREKIEGEIARLNQAKTEKTQGETATANTNNNTVNEYNLIEDYNTKINEINNIADEKTRRLKENELNQELLNQIDYERIQTQKELEKNPSDPALQKKLEELNGLYEKTSKQVAENENWLNGETASQNQNNSTQNTFEKAVPNYGNDLNDIYESNLTAEEKDQKIKELNQSTLNTLNEKIQETEAILESDPNNETAKSDLNHYNQIKNQIETNPNQTIVEPTTVEDFSSLNTKVTRDDLLPNYSSKISSIENSNESELNKAIEKQDLNKILLKKINKQIQEIEAELANDPSNKKDLEKRLKNLKTLKTEVETEIREDQLKIDELSTTANTNTNISVEEVNPNYSSAINEINSLEDQSEKENAIQKLNEETLEIINSKIDEIGDDPNRQVEKDNLTKLKTNIENNISQSHESNLSEQNFVEVDPKVSSSDLIPTYDSDLASIENSGSNEATKAQQKIDLNNQLINKIDREIADLKTYLATNPSNAKDVEKRIANLEKLKADKQAENQANQAIVEANPNDVVKTNTNTTVESINPDYVAKMVEIEKIENQTEKENAIKALNEETIGLIDDKIDEIGVDETRMDEKVELQNLKTNIQNNITQAQDANELNRRYGNLTVKVSPSDLIPTYDSDLAAIDNSGSNEATKAQQKIDLNNQLINKIDREIADLKTYLATNPSNAKDVEKRIANLEKLKADKQAENQTNQAIVEANPNDVVKTNTNTTVESINPDYVAKMVEIEKIENQTEKENAIKALNEETIGLIDDKIDEIGVDETRMDEKVELQNLKTNIQNNITQAQDANELNRRYGNLTVKVSPADLISTYDSDLAAIDNSGSNEATKAQQKIDLNNQLINKIDREIADLKTYLATNPSNAKDVEKRIANLEKLKADKQAENQTNQAIVDKQVDVVSISIGDLMPDYESNQNAIQNSTELSTEDKLKNQNKLNEDLIEKIDIRIGELERIKLAQPEKEEEINIQIAKLNELKELKQNEIAQNNKLLNSMDATANNNASIVKELSDLKEDNFSTTQGKETFNSLESNFNELEAKNNEIESLQSQKNNATNEKDKQKIEDKINKLEVDKAKIENEIIEELEVTNTNELKEKNNYVLYVGADSKSSGVQTEESKSADEKVKLANEKINQAKLLRDEAKQEKDPILANNKLKMAIVLEEEAKFLLEDANQIYQAEVVSNELNNSTETSIVSVPENTENRESTQLFNQANELNKQADELDNKAMALRDSAETVKKKYKQAIIIEAEENEKTANDLRIKANQLNEKANIVKIQEDELLAVIPEQDIVEVSEEEKNELATTNTYKFYYGSLQKAEDDLAKANELEKQIEEKKKQNKRIIKQAIVVGGNESAKTNPEVLKIQAEIDSLTKLQNQYKNSAMQSYADAKRTLENSDLSEDSKNNIVAMANANEIPKDKQEQVDPTDADFVPPTVLKTDIFTTTNTPIYNTVKDIPVDQKQPEGLVYKVQIGAFRNEPRKAYFDKFAPVSGQTLDNGITRYMVGYFTTFNKANSAKTEVRGMGDYKDAFVVAYYNGKRISMAEAKAIEANGVTNDNNQFVINETNDNNGNNANNETVENNSNQNNNQDNNNNTQNNNENTNQDTSNENNVNNSISVQPSTNEEKQLASYYTDAENAAPANQVEIMKGLFFTVQIGVYSKPVPLSALFNTQPLNSQLTESGKIRYTTGIYNNVADANLRKEAIIETGIKDAFVTAYYNGKRITIAEARSILNENGESVLFTNGGQATTTNENGNNSDTNSENNANTNETENNTNSTENPKTYQKEKITYKVLIGTFEDKVPTEYNKYIFNEGDVTYEPQLEGNKIYLLSSTLQDLDEVNEVITELDELGLENMEVVTYYDNQPISFTDGQKITQDNFEGELNVETTPNGISAADIFYVPEAIYYKVVTLFTGEVPVEIANAIIMYEPGEIEEELDEDGHTVYSSQKYESYVEAQTALEKFKSDGFKNAEIKAFYKYSEISIEKAKSIKGK